MPENEIRRFLYRTPIILLLGAYLMMMTSCFSIEEIPYGVWRSNDPHMTLFITTASEETGLYYGEYGSGANLKKVEIDIDMSKGGWMVIDDSEALTEDGFLKPNMEYTLFSGNIRIYDFKLIYRLKPAYQEKTGYEEIIFEKIGDYSPPSSLSPIVADVVKKPNGAI